MKKEIKWIFIGWLGFLFVLFLMWQLDIVLSGIQAIIIILLVLILGGIWIGTMVLEKNVLTGADTKKAFEFVQKWWKDVYNEELTNKWINCTTRYYGKEKFFGFIIRKKLGLEPVNIIVKAEPLDIARVIEIPEYAQTSLIHNPFYGFSPTLKGVPVNYPEAEWIGHQQPWRPATIVNVGQSRGERELNVLEKKEERHE